MGSPTTGVSASRLSNTSQVACMLFNMKPKTQNAVRCAAYQGRKREQDAATDRRRRASRTRRQSKRKAPDHPADEVAAWSKKRLKVPPGHERAGEPMELPKFVVDFLRDVLQPDRVIRVGFWLGARTGSPKHLASLWCWPTWLTAGRFAVRASGAPLSQSPNRRPLN